MNTLIRKYENEALKNDVLPVRPGDKVRVHMKVVEGEKERVQVFEGVIISRKGAGAKETITVRKVSYGIGVERIFPIHSPRVENIEFISRGHVRRAKLYYLRNLRGKAARLREKRFVMPVPEGQKKPGKKSKEARKK